MNEFDDIIGYDATKEELVRIADALKNAERYRKLGMTSPRGLILYGRPGTGKTLMANCLIKASGTPCIHLPPYRVGQYLHRQDEGRFRGGGAKRAVHRAP